MHAMLSDEVTSVRQIRRITQDSAATCATQSLGLIRRCTGIKPYGWYPSFCHWANNVSWSGDQ